ncbi:MAG: putative transposase [Alphaproteobacteria bacterium]|jgi:putative transposase
MRYRVIDAQKATLSVERLCQFLNVSSSGYYAWRDRQPNRRQLDDMVYLAHIRSHFSTSHGTYGSPRMHVELKESRLAMGRHRVARLMRENDLIARQKTRFKRTTDSDHRHAVAANILNQNFSCDAPDHKWGVDISYIWTAEGWLYLAIVLDLFSRRIVGWAVSNRIKKDLAIKALQRAVTLRSPPPGLVHHSDRGSQYCSDDYQTLLANHKLVCSMSGKGNCYDNAMVETVFKTIKPELIWRTCYANRREAENAIGQYIDGFYNPRRRHSLLGYQSPLQYEAARDATYAA